MAAEACQHVGSLASKVDDVCRTVLTHILGCFRKIKTNVEVKTLKRKTMKIKRITAVCTRARSGEGQTV